MDNLELLRQMPDNSINLIYCDILFNTGKQFMMSVMNNITAGKNLNTRWQRIADLKTRAKVLVFLQRNNITDMGSLAAQIEQMYRRQHDVSTKLKAAERRLATLDEHLAQSEIIRQHRAVFQKYEQLDPKKQKAFYEKHGKEIRAYESAKGYFEKVMNGREKLPIKAWKEEQSKLIAGRFELYDEYYKLKDDVKNVEVLRRGAENIMSDILPDKSSVRLAHDAR